MVDSELVQDGRVDVVDAAPPQMTSVSSRCPRCFRSAIFNSTARSNTRAHCSENFSIKNLASTARMSQRSFERRFQQAARMLLHDLSPPCPHQRCAPSHREFIAFATRYFINLRIL
jgi:AraC-like DNA-binding protein